MTDEYTILQDFLKKTGLKLTPERQTILRVVFEIHKHFDADELVDILRQKGKRISRATVYRTLDLLVKSGLIRAMQLTESKRVYEHIVGHEHHDHMICTQCGRIIEFDDGFIETLQQKVCDRMGFQPERHSLRIFGRCDKCR